MAATLAAQELVKQKLAAFEQLQPTFEECFPFVQQVHGQRRFATFSIDSVVRYLHALWVCECKDRLLSIYRNIERYEGIYCLHLLRNWQEGETADVVDFLQRKLDMMPFADLTRQIHEAKTHHKGDSLSHRLIDGRGILLNRGMNLMQMYDAIFALPEEQLFVEVRAVCTRYGHTLEQIERQIAELRTDLYTYVPSQALAQRNMGLMNKMGVSVMSRPSDQPGNRSWRVLEPTIPPVPFAEHVIDGYIELTAPEFNNPKDVRFVDRPEESDTGTM
ncbi:MAG TPA: hypothetical protein VJO32_11455 [Ktedonobacteraceae bacterium]|nr:hypothetical protein [Ktedonobacteraceae bacterium]